MKYLADLYQALDRTNKTQEKVVILTVFFREAPPEETIWALALLSGRRPRRQVNTTQLRTWAAEQAAIPMWLFDECHAQTGDLAETIALLLPEPRAQSIRSTGQWVALLDDLKYASPSEQRQTLHQAWDSLTPPERLVFNKLITGGFRIGVSQALVTRALSEATGIEPSLLAHRLMGQWNPRDVTLAELFSPERAGEDLSRPYPFCLAHPLETAPTGLGPLQHWLVEWKWDGIRGQLIRRGDRLFIWSRGEELVTERFPELGQLVATLPEGTVLDGEILPYQDRPLGFSVLQTRLGRKTLTQKILREAPVVFMAYDLLEWQGKDLRALPLAARREPLRQILGPRVGRSGAPLLLLSEELTLATWEEVAQKRLEARAHFTEGLMLKRRDAPYATGRSKGIWWKWKTDPLSIDAVLVYAQAGHGRRAGLFSDYTLAVWEGDELVPFAKAYSGLSDSEIRQVDTFIKRHTLQKKGPVRIVAPELVFEIGFTSVAPSTRHRAGVAVRFPRILRWRRDKVARDADTLDSLKTLAHLPEVVRRQAPTQLDLFQDQNPSESNS